MLRLPGPLRDFAGKRSSTGRERAGRLMFVFEDIVHVSNLAIQAVLSEIDNGTLARALKNATRNS